MTSPTVPGAVPTAPGAAGADPSLPGRLAGRLVTRGHDRAVAAVRAMIAGRVPHALLIGGPAGIGKTTLAFDLAAGLLCHDPDPAARPCRDCRGCRLVERGRHPDVHRLAPSGPGDQIKIGVRERPDDGTVRRLASDLVLLPVEGGARVAIIERADRLTDDAQTALLKTLEEPPAGVTIILCADDEDRLLPTVRSRCARLRLGPVATRDVEAILAGGGVADPPLAARLARIVGGRPGAARTLARAPAALAARDEMARSLLDLLGAPIASRLGAARDLSARATDYAKAVDRAVAADPGGGLGADAAGGLRGGRGTRGATTRAVAASSSVAPIGDDAPIASNAAAGPTGDAADDASSEDVEEAGGKGSAPAAERRRAAGIVIGLWRDVARDLLVICLGDERQVRDPGLLDDYRSTAKRLAASAGPAALLAGHLRRLDAAGELLEANVRPELVLDTLLLHWDGSR
jgi:DNA polymerase III delta' subunit